MLPLEQSAILLTASSDNWSGKQICGLFERGRFTQVLLYTQILIKTEGFMLIIISLMYGYIGANVYNT